MHTPWFSIFSPPPPASEPTRTYEANVNLLVAPDSQPETKPRLVSIDDVNDWMTAAESREYQVFQELETLMSELEAHWPRRIKLIRKQIAWLRSEAHQRGLEWGQEE